MALQLWNPLFQFQIHYEHVFSSLSLPSRMVVYTANTSREALQLCRNIVQRSECSRSQGGSLFTVVLHRIFATLLPWQICKCVCGDLFVLTRLIYPELRYGKPKWPFLLLFSHILLKKKKKNLHHGSL